MHLYLNEKGSGAIIDVKSGEAHLYPVKLDVSKISSGVPEYDRKQLEGIIKPKRPERKKLYSPKNLDKNEEKRLATQNWKQGVNRVRSLIPLLDKFLQYELTKSGYQCSLYNQLNYPNFNIEASYGLPGKEEKTKDGNVKYSGTLERITGSGGSYDVKVHPKTAYTPNEIENFLHIIGHWLVEERTGMNLGEQGKAEHIIDNSIVDMFYHIAQVYNMPEFGEAARRTRGQSGYLDYIV